MLKLYGAECLLHRATPVERFDSELHDVCDLIRDVLWKSNGVAVSANQVGSNLAVFGFKSFPDDKAPLPTSFAVNPRITGGSREMWTYREGCLSMPKLYWDINRPRDIQWEYFDDMGARYGDDSWPEVATTLKARMIQHECDHLAGRLILDKLAPWQRRKAVRTLNERIERYGIDKHG